MLPVIGYSLPCHALECLSDPAVEAVDILFDNSLDAGRVAALHSRHPFGVVNFDLGSLALTEDFQAWRRQRQSLGQLAAAGWGTTVSVSLTAQSPEPGDDTTLIRVVELVRSLQASFEGSRLYLEIVPAVKEPATLQRDADFLVDVLQKTGCGWLLNVADTYARSRNLGFDPYDQIAEVLPSATNVLIRASSVRFEKRIGAVVTVTEGAIPDEVWSLLRHSLVLGIHKTRAVVFSGRERRGGETLRKSDLRHARFIVDRVQGRQRMLKQQGSVRDFLARGTIRHE
ncbi:hypothetical protein Pan44_31970 [Caulifigura coniformis]|uniref:Xylose isomerase-like TIM barrel n=1 Tax=Caulifigura coniformis TaxID=2527983 RepID=A0A517SG90_9PLAN|nr:DUF692 family multinuclear iron-containing protein [Caulifigura coniformis]QDT55155.1 hypothetical protein Pan44_31970 [Caulifigura coniformis]